jgi:oligopeptide transport system permease protein
VLFRSIINYQDAISVGLLIDQGQQAMQSYPYLLFFPAIYIAVLMISFNLFGNGLRDAFNPSLRGVE